MTKKKQSDLDFEIQFYEGVLKKKDDFVQVLMALGDLYTRKGLYAKGLTIDRKLSHLRPEDPIVLYNLACSYSLVAEIEKSFATIQLAVQCGYDDIQHLEHDQDLINLREDSRFQKYLAQVKKKSAQPSQKTKKKRSRP